MGGISRPRRKRLEPAWASGSHHLVPEQLSLASGKRQGHENGVTGQKLASVEDSWKLVQGDGQEWEFQ